MKLKKLVAAIAMALSASMAYADNVLIIGGEGDSHARIKTELELRNHTVTYQAGTSGPPADISSYQQIWDMRYGTALTADDMAKYDTFLQNRGYLYLSGEHGGFAVRNNSIGAFTSSLGGGSISVAGFASNDQTANATYFTGGATVDFAAAAIITSAGGRVLSSDGSGNATAKMWIGNAGDLGQTYNGTVVVVADINWSQGWMMDANNVDFLQQLLGGIVAGTVGGTISNAGNGAAGGGNSTPPAPTTFSSTNTGETVVTDTMAAGTFTGNGGVLQAASGATSVTNDISLSSPGMTFDNNGQTISLTGAVSGTGGLTFSNTGSGGSTSLDGTYTYTGATRINSGATVVNNSNISSSSQLTNLGTFTNSATGVTGNWINGFNGDGNTAVLNNAGTMGNGTNYSTFNNTGTVGTVQNVGAFNNSGNTGAINNSGVLTNNAGGTVSQLAYNNHIVNNSGTITTVTYNGGTVNNNGTIGSINNEEAHGTFHNNGTVSGTVTTNSTFNNNGTVVGLYTNGGALNNTGTMGNWINNATITNSGTMGNGTNNANATFTNNSGATVGNTTNAGTFTNAGTVGTLDNTGSFANAGTTGDWNNTSTLTNAGTMGNGTNSGTYTNSGTVGNVANSGTYTNSGNAGTVTNTGTLNYNGGTLGGYNQTSPGITVMFAGTPVTVSGAAALGGGLVINNAPTAYGRYTLLNAGSITGQYDAFVSGTPSDYLRYSDTDVKLYVTPPAGATQSSVDEIGKNFANALNLQTNAVTAGLGNDCAVFGDKGGCVSVNVGQSKAGTGDLNSGGITVSKSINSNWRAGVFGTGALNNPQNGPVAGKTNPATGGFVTWTDGKASVQASVATNTGDLTVTRNGPEVGVGTSSVKNTAYQVRGSYLIPIDEKTSVTPYVGLRQVDTKVGGYTETGPTFPLTVDASNRSATSVIAGATVARKLTDKLTGSVSAGVVQRISENNPGYTGSSEIAGMSSFNSAVPGNGKTNASFGAGLSYKIDDSTSVGVNAGVQQKGSNANISSVGVTLTKGF